MNWDAIGAIGELVGATAVVVSIIYLALQVRQSSTHVRSSGYQTAVQSANQYLESLTTHPETLRVFHIALESYDKLDEEEQIVARMLFMQLFMYYEAFYYQYTENVVHPDIWEGRKRMMLNLLQMPGLASWWEDWRYIYGEKFQKYVAEANKSPSDLHFPL